MGKVKNYIIHGEEKRLLFTGLSGIALVFSFGGWFRDKISFDLAWISILLSGIPIIYGAAKALIMEHDIKADLLVSMALIGSIYIGEWFAAGEVAFIMQIGSILEDITAAKAKDGINKLIKLTPKTARVKRSEKEENIPVENVKIGDELIILAGETIPLDGIITSGSTSINQAVMTGESIPVDKTVGDEVTSGTVNQFGTFTMKVRREEKDSSLQRLIRLAKEADENKAPIVSLTDKWATWMVIASFLTAVITGIITHELIRAVTVLVVFCPCAFILATPTAVMAGIGNASKYGILIKSGDALERFSKIKYIAFDKTGTLTNGTPKVIAVETLGKKYNDDEIFKIAVAAEKMSEHPLGKAICSSYKGKVEYVAENFEVIAGKGISCKINNSQVLVGKMDLMNSQKVKILPAQLNKDKKFIKEGATITYISIDGNLEGMIILADTVRSTASDMIARLKEVKVEPILLTGDNEEAARHIAGEVGIENVQYNLLPENKMEVIKKYMDANKNICMIGDGINDALALSTAYAGIAMGGIGSDIAVESSDAVLVNDDVDKIPYLLYISEKSMRKVNFNIAFSMGLNFIAVVLAATGVLNPVWGALVHNCGSVFVVINSALLLKERKN